MRKGGVEEGRLSAKRMLRYAIIVRCEISLDALQPCARVVKRRIAQSAQNTRLANLGDLAGTRAKLLDHERIISLCQTPRIRLPREIGA